MSALNFRDYLKNFCLVCVGIPRNVAEDNVLQFFQSSKKVKCLEPSQSEENPKWLILYENYQIVQHLLHTQKTLLFQDQTVDLQPCTVPCDIPTEWEEIAKTLQEREATEVKQRAGWGDAQGYPTGVPGQPGGFQGQPGNIPRPHGQEGVNPGEQGIPGGPQTGQGDMRYPGQYPPLYYHPGYNQWFPQGFFPGQIPGQGSPKGMPQPEEGKGPPGIPPHQFMSAGFDAYQMYGYGPYHYPPPPYNSGKEPNQDVPREGYTSKKIEEDQARKMAAMNINRTESEEESQESESDHQSEEEEEEKKSSGMIKVTGIPSKVSEDTLTFFFENRRKSGGGEIDELEYDKNKGTAVITFEDPEAVERVIQKMPLLLEGKQIYAECFVPDNFHDDQLNKDDSEEESKPSFMIEVRGMKTTTSNDTIEFYFESKRAAGVRVDIEKFDVQEEDDNRVIYITYQCEEDLRRILQRKHKVDGTELEVKEYIPPPPPKPRPLYEEKALLKGVNPDTTKDGLENFLEAKSGVLPIDLMYGEEDGVVLVTFEEPPDFEKLQQACKKRSLDGSYLHVLRVPISNCIVVQGIGEKTGRDTIEFYFENHRRSGGGEVIDVKMNEEDGTCLVYFEDHEVITEVCKKTHKIDGNTLTVKLYHDMLGEATTAEEGPKFKLPEPVVITTLDPRKVQFLLSSEINRKAVEKQMQSGYAKITWPKIQTEPVKLECLLTKEIKNSNQLVKTWKKSALDGLNKYLEVLSVNKHEILQDIWPNVIAELQKMEISHPDGVAVAVEKVTFEIFVMGHKQFAEDLSKQIKGIVTKVTEEADRKKKQVTEKMNIKYHQLMMLSFLRFGDEMEKKFTGMKIYLDLKKKEIIFEGLAVDVTSAKLKMYEKTQTLCESKLPTFSDRRYKFLQHIEVKKYVTQKMKDKNVVGVWEIEDSSLSVYSTSDQDAVTAAHILRDSVVETLISVKQESIQLLMEDTWDLKKDEIIKTAKNCTEIVSEPNTGKIIILSTDVDAGNIRELVETFILGNTVYERHLNLSEGILRHIEQHKSKEIRRIEKDLTEDKIKIECSNLGILIKGTELGINKAQPRIDQLVQKVRRKEHTMTRPGIGKLLDSQAGKDKMSIVENEKGVTITSSDSDSNDDDYPTTGGQRGNLVQELALCTTKKCRVHSMLGDMTELQVDVLVNAANKDLQHTGGLAKAILLKGGRSIQDECTAHVNMKGKLMEGEVFCSRAGSLPCKMVVHAVGPVWQGGNNQELELLREAVMNSVETASDNNYTSIALPALGAGVFGVPARTAVKTIVESIRDSYKEIRNNSIADVYLCDVKQENVNLFTEKLKTIFGADKVTITQNSAAGNKWKTTQTRRTNFKQASPDQRFVGPSGTIKMKVVKGQIAKQKVDVIVNTTSKDLKLSNGAVSASLLQAAGAAMQAECDSNYPDGINHGEVAVTQGFNLRCKLVCHGSLPSWSGGATSLKILQPFMLGCLKEANKRRHSTVAFPAMGTGNLGYPKETVAKEMFRIVSQYSSQNPTSSVKDVWFVVYDKDYPTIKAFEEVEDTYASRSPELGAAGGINRKAGDRQSRKFGSQFGSSTSDEDQTAPYLEPWNAVMIQGKPTTEAPELLGRQPVSSQPVFTLGHAPYGGYHSSPDLIPTPYRFSGDSDFQSKRQLLERQNIVERLNTPLPKPKPRLRTLQHAKTEMDLDTSTSLRSHSSLPVLHKSLTFPSDRTSRLLEHDYRLDDKDMDTAMSLLKKQFPNISGLMEVSVLEYQFHRNVDLTLFSGNFIQICHTGKNHWVTVTNIGCAKQSIRVFDSFYRNPTSKFIFCVCNLIKSDRCLFVTLLFPRYQKQNFKGDCGLFAIAAMVSIANGNDPSVMTWDSSKMRGHLVQCIADGYLTEFPVVEGGIEDQEENYLPKSEIKIDLCCSCRNAITRKEPKKVTCYMCSRLCHQSQKCAGIDSQPSCSECRGFAVML